MKLIYLTLFTLLSISLAQSQDVILVSDYYAGEEDGYDEWNHTSHPVGDDFLIPLFKPEHGLELGILKNGSLSLLKDINPGADSGAPRNFYTYRGAVYFSCETISGEHTLWKTDGTADGTVQVFDAGNPSSLPLNFLESDSGHLYFGYDSAIYRTDGTDFSLVAPVRLRSYSTVTQNVVPYAGEIAIIDEGTSQKVIIHTVDASGQVSPLMEMSVNSATDVRSFISLGDYLMFELDDWQDDELSGLYYWTTGAASPTRLDLPITPARLLKIRDDVVLGTFSSEGVSAFQATSSGVTVNEVFEGSPADFVQGETMAAAIKQGKVLYEGLDEWPDENMLITDVNSLETNVSFEVDGYMSNMICHNNFAFIAGGTSNGFDPTIHYYDFKNDDAGNVKDFEERSLRTNSIILVGVQNGRIYFLCNLYPETGREMYSVDISDLAGLDVSVEQTAEVAIDMKFYDNGFELKHDDARAFDYSLHTITGELISKAKGETNQYYSFAEQSGMMVVKVLMASKEYTYLTPVLR